MNVAFCLRVLWFLAPEIVVALGMGTVSVIYFLYFDLYDLIVLKPLRAVCYDEEKAIAQITINLHVRPNHRSTAVLSFIVPLLVGHVLLACHCVSTAALCYTTGPVVAELGRFAWSKCKIYQSQ